MDYKLLFEVSVYRKDRISSDKVDKENYISTENMLPNRGGVETATTVASAKTFPAYKKGDILLSNIRPYFKKIWYADKEGGCSNDVLVVKGNKTVDNKFLYYVLSDNNFFNYSTVTSKGTKMPRGSKNAIMKYWVPDLDLLTQRKIADILSSYDELIKANNERIELLEQVAQELYREWFVRFRFPGHETAEFENGIPEGWAYRRADEVIDFNPTLKTGNQTEFTIIPMEALSTNSMVLDSGCFVRQDSISGRRSQNGDTLLAKITPCLENGKTGFVMGMPENEVLGGSTEFVVMRSKALTPHYVYCIARSYYFRQTAILSMNGADGRQRVDEDKLKSTKILQPEKTVLDHFETIVTPIFDGVYQMVQENKNLIQQRDLLLPRLMSGKLEVQYALND